MRLYEMKTLIRMLILAAFVLLSNACEPDPDPEPEPDTSIEFNINDETHPAVPVQTVLGEDRTNPYTVDNMTQAADNIYGINRTGGPVPTTNLYVKFTPSSLDDIEAMYETDETFYDFPLTHEVITMGDYYQDLAQDEFPELYAVVPPDFQFPSVAYEILAPLHIAPYDTYLVQEAFALTNNPYDGLSTQTSQSFTVCEEFEDNGSQNPDWPECQCDNFLGNPTLYDECIADVTVTNEPPPPTVNDCTNPCPTYGHQRKPAGRVMVEDTQLSPTGVADQPVRRVKIILKDTWFTEDETWTDDCGCWRINDKYHGRAWMWVKFKNDRAKIRGTTRHWYAIWEWAIPVKDYVGVLWGPNFDNISINYEMWDVTDETVGRPAHLYWGAATINNALHEFHDYAAIEGIAPPPDNLDIYAARNGDNAYALMSAQTHVVTDFLGPFVTSAAFANPYAGLVAAVGWAIAIAAVPDVCIGIKNELPGSNDLDPNNNTSDQLKQVIYHELAHASHHTQVSSLYWRRLAEAEILAGGHGDENSLDAGIISICESWAEHVGLEFAHKTYRNTSTSFVNGDTYLDRVEVWRNESANHVPIGYYHDLIDGINLNEPVDDQDGPPTFIVDNVQGFTNAYMFSLLDNSTDSPQDFTNRVITTNPTANTIQQINDLFNSY